MRLDPVVANSYANTNVNNGYSYKANMWNERRWNQRKKTLPKNMYPLGPFRRVEQL